MSLPQVPPGGPAASPCPLFSVFGMETQLETSEAVPITAKDEEAGTSDPESVPRPLTLPCP